MRSPFAVLSAAAAAIAILSGSAAAEPTASSSTDAVLQERTFGKTYWNYNGWSIPQGGNGISKCDDEDEREVRCWPNWSFDKNRKRCVPNWPEFAQDTKKRDDEKCNVWSICDNDKGRCKNKCNKNREFWFPLIGQCLTTGGGFTPSPCPEKTTCPTSWVYHGGKKQCLPKRSEDCDKPKCNGNYKWNSGRLVCELITVPPAPNVSQRAAHERHVRKQARHQVQSGEVSFI